jgi:uncharacterized SAM-binding protein YcdF (DUF218 family)
MLKVKDWRRIASGAAVGFMVAGIWLYAHLPGPSSAYSNYVLGFGLAVGAATVAFGWTLWFGYVAIGVALIQAPVTCTGVLRTDSESWVRRDVVPPAPLDAVVVLSGSIDDDGHIGAVALTRLVSGVELMKRNHARLLITTRVAHPDGRGGVATSDADQAALIEIAVDTASWKIVGPTESTRDEAVRAAALLAPASAHTIAVVTSPMHSRRACDVFEAVGFKVVCAPSVEREYDVHWQDGVYDRARAMSEYAYERLAMLKYRSRGWIR